MESYNGGAIMGYSRVTNKPTTIKESIIIYQFKMLSDGTIKISSAEYKKVLGMNYNVYYKKIRLLEKGVKCPKFPVILKSSLGTYYYGDDDYYALSMDDLNSFKEDKIKSLEQSIEARECEIKHYKDMIANLRSENQ